MNKAIIVTSFASDNLLLKNKNFPLFALEKGVKKVIDLNLFLEKAIGDFDTLDYSYVKLHVEDKKIISLPTKKDYSDTEFALQYIIENYNYKCIDILCSLNGRYDHSHALLLLLKKYNKYNVTLIDDYNKIVYLDKGEYIIKKEDYSYFSLFGFPSSEVTLKDVEYCLDKYDLKFDETLTLSNAFLKDKDAFIKVHKGGVLLIRSKD